MIKTLLFLLLIIIGLGPVSLAQTGTRINNSSNNLQYGISVKATVVFDLKGHHPNPYFRLGIDGGIASTFITNAIYQAVNLEIQFYNAGLGTRNRLDKAHNFGANLEWYPAFTLTTGWPNRLQQPLDNNRFTSLYYFSDFARPALCNPFDHSLSVGTILCFTSDTAKQFQRLGFIGLNFGGGAQFSYYNDGGPLIAISSLGDGDDRYHTGGGLLSYNGPRNTFINTIELAYHKFTGYSKSSFEASNKLFLAFMDYHDPEQQFYNRSVFDLNLTNLVRGYGMQLQWYNSVEFDLQHDIHTAVLNTYHMVPYAPPYWTIGLTYYGAYQNTGLR